MPVVVWNGKQAVCRCPAYAFPHRLGGGACTGYFMAQECFNEHIMCAGCEFKGPYGCEVMAEQTSPKHCPYVEDFCVSYQIRIK